MGTALAAPSPRRALARLHGTNYVNEIREKGRT